MREIASRKTTINMRDDGKRSYSWCKRLRTEEEGSFPSRQLGHRDKLYSSLYYNMSLIKSWDPSTTINHTAHGAVFNLEFSPDGSMLVAACEKKSILVFDSLRGTLVNHVNNAHNACVNCVKFLDSRMFATCSDDNTVSIWDIRYLKHKIRSLKGHSNWVKNIEYAQDVGLLVTASFDGSIYTWDINRYSESDIPFKRVLHTEGLMRAKISPDFTKLVICTSHGCIMVIHDLNLSTLGSDLRSFQPTIYRLMQTTNAPIHLACKYNHLFTNKRNRVELITDFPKGNDAEVISSLQIHPQSWSVVSRNTSTDDTSEWSCMHDLHSYPVNLEDVSPDEEKEEMESEDSSNENSLNSDDGTSAGEARPFVHIRFNYRPPTAADETNREGTPNEGADAASSSSGSSVGMTFRLPVASLEIFEALAATLAAAHRNRLRNAQAGAGNINSSDSTNESVSGGVTNDSRTDALNIESRLSRSEASGSGEQTTGDRSTLLLDHQFRDSKSDDKAEKNRKKIMKNRARMTHYIVEPNVGRGFIKELCFSTDGRLVCSPYDHGVRLLSFNENCEELCDCVPVKPSKFHVVASSESHPKVVVCTKFAPNHSLLVSGCLGGKICFYQPNFQ